MLICLFYQFFFPFSYFNYVVYVCVRLFDITWSAKLEDCHYLEFEMCINKFVFKAQK